LGAHHRDDPVARQFGDLLARFVLHRVLEGAAHFDHCVLAAVADQRLLRFRERLFEHHDDDVLVEDRAGLRGTSAGVLAQARDDSVGDG
jgi:hypothetical protein